ncbi:MAG: polysaccharide biosynthesis/export family protein [Pyrinomonadaceae bacterium]
MKKALSIAVSAAFAFIFAFVTLSSIAIAQIKEPRAASTPQTIGNNAPRNSEKKSAAVESKSEKLVASDDKPAKKSASDAPEKSAAITKPAAVVPTPAPSGSAKLNASAADAPVKTNASANNTNAAAAPAPAVLTSAVANNIAPPLFSIYRVAAGDTLDIRLLNTLSRESTLYTVLSDGTIDYPLAGEPVKASGLTAEEIAARLASRIKLYDKPQVTIGIRDYASHNVIVTGLVENPGTKILRREAVPLYVVLAEAQPRLEAARVSIVRAGTQIAAVELQDQTQAATLVMPGDFIKVMGAPPLAPQFYFIGGQIGAPGQKDFHAGLTLTQAILASGGTTRFAGSKAKVSRQGADGRLTATEYNLKQIEEGKTPDPHLQPGDRLEVGRGHW